jgi:hypothetical protein
MKGAGDRREEVLERPVVFLNWFRIQSTGGCEDDDNPLGSITTEHFLIN